MNEKEKNIKIEKLRLGVAICAFLVLVRFLVVSVYQQSISYVLLNILTCLGFIFLHLNNVENIKKNLSVSDDVQKKILLKLYTFTKIVFIFAVLYIGFCVICTKFINDNNAGFFFIPNIIFGVLNLWTSKKLLNIKKKVDVGLKDE